jgi:hypothetical protein
VEWAASVGVDHADNRVYTITSIVSITSIASITSRPTGGFGFSA